MVDESEMRPNERGILPETLKKALVTGISAVFMTEEGIRSALSDMRLPKEAMAYLIQQTQNSRRELFRVVSDELKSFLRNIDLPGEVKKALSGMKLEVKAEIKFVDEGSGKVSAKVTSDTVDKGDAPATKHRRRKT